MRVELTAFFSPSPACHLGRRAVRPARPRAISAGRREEAAKPLAERAIGLCPRRRGERRVDERVVVNRGALPPRLRIADVRARDELLEQADAAAARIEDEEVALAA